MPAQQVSLNCLLHGDRPNNYFQVEISEGETFAALKSLIVQQCPNDYAGIDPHRLTLYWSDIPIVDNDNSPQQPALSSSDKLISGTIGTKLPSSPSPSHVHIIVEKPGKQHSCVLTFNYA